MKVAIAQMNATIADFKGNASKILNFTKKALNANADFIVFPEMCVCGYPPMDLLDQDKFIDECLKSVRQIQHKAPPRIGIILGYVDKNRSRSGKKLINVVSFIHNNKILFSKTKILLPTYDVFDEARYFEPGQKHNVFNFKDKKIGIAICEDIWWEQKKSSASRYSINPVKELLDRGAELLLVPSASPFYSGKAKVRFSLIQEISKSSGIPVIYTNMVGANDSLIFDGQSMYISKDGELCLLAKAFTEDFCIVDLEKRYRKVELIIDKYHEIEQALVLGIRDYISKCGFKQVHLGLSGGIDSTLVAVLAVLALGSENVKGFSLPSRYSSKHSKQDAQELAKRLGIKLEVLSIEEIFPAYLTILKQIFKNKEPDVTEENLQARIRSTLLMAYANKFNSLLLTTGNKSELATGYCTLYGDMSGSLAVIGDLFKTEVYTLARRINKRLNVIPESILNKPPSAELKDNQTDQDTLPPYKILDQILKDYIIKNMTSEQMREKEYKGKILKKVLTMVARAEFKRRQAPPVLKISQRAFGTGRRIPIARSIFEV